MTEPSALKAERLAIANAAVVATDIGYIKRDISEIKEVMKQLPGVYLSQKEHNEFVTAVNTRFLTLEKKEGVQKYLWPILSSALTAVLVFLAINYLQNIK